MKHNYLFKTLCALAIALPVAAVSFTANAQAVIFPQLVQPGEAMAFENQNTYTLSNEVLSASFISENGHLMFNGCEEMGLLPGTEIFRITLGNGKTVNASEMTMKDCSIQPLSANPNAVIGSDKLPGQSIVAHLSYGDLEFEWKAILRDGSHYLRTEVEMTASNDVSMHNVIPMLYHINAENAPQVVGNTRGAVLASNTIFAGLETPTGLNTIETTDTPVAEDIFVADDGFSYNSWSRDTSGDTQPANPAYWNWVSGSQTPEGITALGFSATDIRGKRGFINFSSAGNHSATFKYVSGTHGLNVVGVDVVNSAGEIIASDYHIGFTGGMSNNNVFNVNIPQAGTYLVRYFVEIATETITANGTITWSPAVSAGSAPISNTMTADAGFSYNSWSADTDDLWATTVSDPKYWTWLPGSETPSAITSLGYAANYIRGKRGFIKVTTPGTYTVTFKYTDGSHAFHSMGVDLIDEQGNIVSSDYHRGNTGDASSNNVYTLNIPTAGIYFVRYFTEVKTETITSNGSITWSPNVTQVNGFATIETPNPDDTDDIRIIQGLWSRHTTLEAGKTWKVSAVVGLIAPGQARRSFLAYSERERAVPWRAFPIYNSWYELNIDRNNSATYANHMTTQECVDVVNQWHTNLYENHQANIQAFVWDDGWDSYGTWTFNKNFPNGFDEPNAAALRSGAGIGTWLGPVGGYGNSGNLRRSYWTNKGGMQLSNPAYYKVFLDACNYMIEHYDFRFFKLDGISAQFSSVGPDSGYTGEENAEGIINILSEVRKIRPDMFFNTTVGTWASPFWFHFTDAVWRQEADHSTIGNQGDDRERWITYRDRLVYQNFVQNSPLCPINTLMTHGVILTTNGDVSKSMDYDGIVREIRCAFACGSGMVELYCDANLLNTINNGALWGDIADCIKWQETNADVLPDIHWVGGNPWDGSKANIYGWASWNGEKATLALRNPSTSPATYTFTLREALDIPDYFTESISLTKSFENQAALTGLDTERNYSLDEQISVTLPGSSVYVFDGEHRLSLGGIENIIVNSNKEDNTIFDIQGRPVKSDNLNTGIYVQKHKKFLVK